jgi:diguanylate cyclase (GGDEF)-like protein
LASSLRTAEVMRQLESRADRDPLTELRHGGSFRVDLARALSDRRFASRTAVLAIDVDNFKEVNDTRGHPMGDDVLRRLAMTLAGALRDADRVYRVGGDEFAALLRVRDGSDALATAQRLRSAVRQAGDLPTLSIGVAVQEPREDPQDLVQRADAALYAVKRGGRDGTRLHAS